MAKKSLWQRAKEWFSGNTRPKTENKDDKKDKSSRKSSQYSVSSSSTQQQVNSARQSYTSQGQTKGRDDDNAQPTYQRRTSTKDFVADRTDRDNTQLRRTQWQNRYEREKERKRVRDSIQNSTGKDNTKPRRTEVNMAESKALTGSDTMKTIGASLQQISGGYLKSMGYDSNRYDEQKKIYDNALAMGEITKSDYDKRMKRLNESGVGKAYKDWEKGKAHGAFQKVYNKGAELNEAGDKNLQEVMEDKKGIKKAYYSAVNSGVGMVTDMALGPAWGTGMLTRVLGNNLGNVRDMGGTQLMDERKASLDALKELGTEYLFRGAGVASKMVGKGAALDLSGKLANKVAGKLTGKAADYARLGVKALAGTAEENAEEAIAWAADPFIDEISYGKDLKKATSRKSLQEQSRSFREELGDLTTEEAQAVAMHMNSDAYMNDLAESYKQSGMTDDQARKAAGLMRDYLVADLAGDEDKAKDIESQLTNVLYNADPYETEYFGKERMQELGETFAATTLLTLGTGAPGAVMQGVSLTKLGKQQKADIEANLGAEGLKKYIKQATDFDDPDISTRAQAMSDTLQSGGELTDIQVGEVAKAYEEQRKINQEAANTSLKTASNQIEDKNLMYPVSITERGDIKMLGVAEEKFDASKENATNIIQELSKSEDFAEVSAQEAESISDAIAGFEVGAMTADMVGQLSYSNTEAREVFERATGVSLAETIVKNKDGTVNIPKTNVATREFLQANAASNLVQTAEATTAIFVDTKKGQLDSTFTLGMGKAGQKVYDAITSESDVTNEATYRAKANAASVYYEAARSYGIETFEDAQKALRANPALKLLTKEQRRQAFEAGLQDARQDVLPDGTVVKEGESIKADNTYKGRGVALIETSAPVKASVANALNRIAEVLNITIHYGENAEILKRPDGSYSNGAYDNGEVWINSAEDIRAGVDFILSHELTHLISDRAGEEYKKLEDLVIKAMEEKMPELLEHEMDIRKKAYGEVYDAESKKFDQMIKEEIVADYAYEMLRDQDFVKDICEREPSLGRAILDVLRDLMSKIRTALSFGIDDYATRNSMLNQLGILKEYEQLWLDGFHKAAEASAEMGTAAVRTEQTMHSILTPRDSQYLDAVKRGDMDEVRKLVVDAANDAGFDTNVFHGSPKFGFTKLDVSFSDDKLSFFTTDKLSVAESYSGVRGRKNVSDRLSEEDRQYASDVIDRANDLRQEAADAFNDVALAEDGEGLHFTEMQNSIVDMLEESGAESAEDIRSEIEEMVEEAYDESGRPARKLKKFMKAEGKDAVNKIMEYADAELEAREYRTSAAGNYEFAINTDNFIEVDGKGNDWNEIPHPETGKPAKTREIGEWAKSKGYDGVKFTNVTDMGGRIDGEAVEAGIYIAFDPQSQVKSLDLVTYDNDGNIIPLSQRFDKTNQDIRYSIVTDKSTIEELENDEHIVTYRSMALIDGKLYPPMASKVRGTDGKWNLQSGMELGDWFEADVTTNSKMFNSKGQFILKKDNDKTVPAAYNPYVHSSTTMLNDQFSSAYQRPNMVTVKGYIPKSEVDNGYRAAHYIDDGRWVEAKDTTGKLEWKAGPVQAKLTGTRTVFLTNHFKLLEVVPDSEVAQHIKELVDTSKKPDTAIPYNVVTPSLRKELLKLGVKMEQNKQDKFYVELDEEDKKLINEHINENADIRYSLPATPEAVASNYNISVEDIDQIKSKKRTNKRDRAILRDVGEKLTEKDFYSFYNRHIVALGAYKTGDSETGRSVAKSIQESGFLGDGGPFGTNVFPLSPYNHISRTSEADLLKRGYSAEEVEDIKNHKYKLNTGYEWIDDTLYTGMNISEKAYAIRPGQTIMLVPETHMDVKNFTVEQGFKPYPYEVVTAKKPYQGLYELYSEAYDKYSSGARFSISLTDSEGNSLSEGQREFFNDSQAVDDNGNLLALYHGTPSGGHTIFSKAFSESGEAFSFTNDPETASFYISEDVDDQIEGMQNRLGDGETSGAGMYKVYLNLKNPKIIENYSFESNQDMYDQPGIAKAEGYDGIIYKNFDDIGVDIYQVFEPNQIKDTRNQNPTDSPDIRYSVSSMAEAVNMRVAIEDGIVKLYDESGEEVTHVTKEIVHNSMVGKLGELSLKNKVLRQDQLDKSEQFVADVMNMILDTQDIDLVYALSGTLGYDPVSAKRDVSVEETAEPSNKFAALTSNSDPQYNKTIDFTTICVKTQAVIDAMSETMKRLGRGLTKDEIVEVVYDEVYKAGEPVPCPVCYVFSRWVGLGGLLGDIKKFQEKYPEDMDISEIKRQQMELQKEVDKIGRQLKAKGFKSPGTKARNQMIKDVYLRKKELDEKQELSELQGKEGLTAAEQAELDDINSKLDVLNHWSWLTKSRLRDDYKAVPEDILFDLNAGREFATNYPAVWSYRTTRGPSLGKAAVPYSPYRLGQMTKGMPSSGKSFASLGQATPNFQKNINKGSKTASNAFNKALKEVKKQNLMNGQREQSTSDFRFEYALDYVLYYLEASMLGTKAQGYTKVPESVRLKASAGVEMNCSLMPLGNGLAWNEDKQDYELVFSDVTGMNPVDAFNLSAEFDNAQPILVAVGRQHLITAMKDDRITFIIPYHASGGTEERYIKMMQTVEEAVDEREDFATYESEHKANNRTKEQKAASDLRKGILMGKKNALKDEEKELLKNTPMLRQLYMRFYGKDEEGNKVDLRETEYAKYVENFDDNGRDTDCYKVALDNSRADLLMPYEYWDKTSTISAADEQGKAYVDYCNMIGRTPVFSGWDENGNYHEDMDFSKMPGYWKTLIDRCMYNNDGTYHKQQAISVENIDLTSINADYMRNKAGIVHPLAVNDPAKTAEIVDNAIARINAQTEAENGPRYSIDLQNVESAKPATEEDAVMYMYEHSDEFETVNLDDMPVADRLLDESRQRRVDLKKNLRDQIESKHNQFKLTKGQVLDQKSVADQAQDIVMRTMMNSDTTKKYKTEQVKFVKDGIAKIYEQLKQGKNQEATNTAFDVAADLVENVDFINDDQFEQYKAYRDYFKTQKIYVPERVRAEFGQGGFTDFVKSNASYLRMTKNSKDVAIDKVWDELCKDYPEYFNDSVTDESEMLTRISEVFDSLKDYKYAYTSEEAYEVIGDVAGDLIQSAMDGESWKSFADEKKAMYDEHTKKLKQRHQESMDEVKGKLDSAKQELRDTKQKLKKTEKKLDQNRAALWEANERAEHERFWGEIKSQKVARAGMKKADKLQAQVDAEKAKAKEKTRLAKRKKNFARIEKEFTWLSSRLIKPTDDKHIPEGFRKELADLLQQIDLQTERSKALEEKYGRVANNTLKMYRLRDELKEIAKEDDSGVFLYDGYAFQLMDALSKKLDGRSVDELEDEDVKDISTILKYIRKNIQNYNKSFSEAIKERISELATESLAAFNKRIERRGKAGKRGNVWDSASRLLNESMLTPIDFFEQLGGGFEKVYKKGLRRGFDRHVQNISFIRDEVFGEILKDYQSYEVKNWRGKKKTKGKNRGKELEKWRDDSQAQEFDLESGKKIKMSPAQIMSLYCLMKRDQAVGHILGSGIVLTDITSESKIKEAVGVKKKVSETERQFVTYADIGNIVKALTPEQTRVADQLMKVLGTTCAEWGNETSMKLYGYRKFTEENYFPIKSADAFLDASFEGRTAEERIRNFGFTKGTVVNANNPIVIDDFFTQVADHINKMSMYNAFAAPIADMQRLFNYKERNEDGTLGLSIREQMKIAYGDIGVNYFTNFMADLNGNTSKKSDGLAKIVDSSLSNYKKAAVGGNIRVLLQQPTAIVRAAAVIDPKYFTLRGVSMKRMHEICAIAKWKNWGNYDTNMSRDLEDIMMDKQPSLLDKYTMDVYGKLDDMTWSVIFASVEKEIKHTRPDLEYDSPEYREAVSDRAAEVFDKTQVVDSVFHRSQAMRNKDSMSKVLTAFKAEPTRTYNMIRSECVKAHDAWLDGDKAKSAKLLSRMATVFALNVFVTQAAASLADLIRQAGDDKDEDLTYLQILLDNLFGFHDMEGTAARRTLNLASSNMSPLTLIYGVQDVLNFAQGWDSSNMAEEGWEGLGKAVNELLKHGEGESKKDLWDINMMFVESLGYLTGVPTKNVKRDVYSILAVFGLNSFADTLEESYNEAAKAIVSKFSGSSESGGNMQGSGGTSGETSTSSEPGYTKMTPYEPGAAGTEGGSKSDKKGGIIKDGSTVDNILNKAGLHLSPAEKADKQHQADVKEVQDKLEEYKAKKEKAGETVTREQENKQLWSYCSKNYTDALESGDIATVKAMRQMYEECGGDVGYVDKQIKSKIKTAYLKTVGDTEDAGAQIKLRNYMKDELGFSDEDISAIVKRSDWAKKLKAAYRTNNSDRIYASAAMLLESGITMEDLDSIYKYRNSKSEAVEKYAKIYAGSGYGVPCNGVISSYFGARSAPTSGASSNHMAIDIAAPAGTNVAAAAGGTVVYAGWYGGYGNQVVIEHPDGTQTYYSHMSAINVEKGQVVTKSQSVGAVGSTGISTGPHLDFKMRVNGQWVDPLQYINEGSITGK